VTPLGVSLLPVMQAIKDWAETHIEQVNAARDTYDDRAGAFAERA
jgi:DNA-binding HxlR family transcriptional regulator